MAPRPSMRFLVALIGVTLMAAGFAVAFRAAYAWIVKALYGRQDIVSAMRALPWWATLLVPMFGGALAGSTARLLAREGAGQGVGEVMEASVTGRTKLSMRATLVRSLGSWFAISSGGSIGREGAIIQFGGSTGTLWARWAGLAESEERALVMAGTAAGFAAAYNTPITAVLFVVEVVTGLVVLPAIVPSIAAVALATAITRAALGGGPIYGARGFGVSSSYELFAHVLLGVIAALAAQAFMRMLSAGETLCTRLRVGQPWCAAGGALLVGAIALALPDVAGNGYEPLNAILDAKLGLTAVALLFVAKMVATTASVATGSPGGVFTPTLLLGAAVGAGFAQLLAKLTGVTVTPAAVGSFALVGMAAMTAATAHAPIMAVTLVFELSGDYGIVLPLMLATATATVVSRALRVDSIYGAELRRKGLGWTVTLEGKPLAAMPP